MSMLSRARSWAQFGGLGARRARADDDEDIRRAEDRDDERCAAPDNGDDGDTDPRDDSRDARGSRRGRRAADDDRHDDEGQNDRDARGSRTGRRADDDVHPENEGDENDGSDGDTDPAELRRGRRGSRAADQDDGDDEHQDNYDRDDEDGEPASRRGRRSRNARAEEDGEDEGQDDDRREMSGRSVQAAARNRERARCAAILGSRYAAANMDLALSLALETTMTRREAIAVLRRTPAREASASASERRRAANPQLGPGGERQLSGPQAIAASWDSALAKAGATTPKAAAGGMEAALLGARG